MNKVMEWSPLALAPATSVAHERELGSERAIDRRREEIIVAIEHEREGKQLMKEAEARERATFRFD